MISLQYHKGYWLIKSDGYIIGRVKELKGSLANLLNQ
jgi:hypothetical protein